MKIKIIANAPKKWVGEEFPLVGAIKKFVADTYNRRFNLDLDMDYKINYAYLLVNQEIGGEIKPFRLHVFLLNADIEQLAINPTRLEINGDFFELLPIKNEARQDIKPEFISDKIRLTFNEKVVFVNLNSTDNSIVETADLKDIAAIHSTSKFLSFGVTIEKDANGINKYIPRVDFDFKSGIFTKYANISVTDNTFYTSGNKELNKQVQFNPKSMYGNFITSLEYPVVPEFNGKYAMVNYSALLLKTVDKDGLNTYRFEINTTDSRTFLKEFSFNSYSPSDYVYNQDTTSSSTTQTDVDTGEDWLND